MVPPNRKFFQKLFTDQVKTSSFLYHIGQSDILCKPAALVTAITSEETQAKIAYLQRCLKRYRRLTGKGVGLAGVQVGIPEQLLVVHIPAYAHQVFTVLNPQIEAVSSEMYSYPEMCVSAAPLVAQVVRPAWIQFSYIDEHGQKQLWDLKGTDEKALRYNRVFQHELDHLQGIINIDLVQSKELFFEPDADFYKHAQFKRVA